MIILNIIKRVYSHSQFSFRPHSPGSILDLIFALKPLNFNIIGSPERLEFSKPLHFVSFFV